MDHLPINPVRRNHYEIAFSACWKELLERELYDPWQTPREESMLDTILDQYPEYPREREDKVCATIISWLGTNVGRGFLDKCGFLKKDVAISEESVLMQWALENRRRRAYDSGWRTLEHLLTDREDHSVTLGGVAHLDIQCCSALDYEAAEHLMMWLGSDEGRTFVKRVLCMANSANIEEILAAFNRGGLEAAYDVLKPFDPDHYEGAA